MTHQTLVGVAGHPLFLRMTQLKETKDLDQFLKQCSEQFRTIRDHYIKTNQEIIDSLNVDYQPPAYGSETLDTKRHFFGAYDPSVQILQTLGRLIRDNLALSKLSLPSSMPVSAKEYYDGVIALKHLRLARLRHERALWIYFYAICAREAEPVTPSEYPAKLS